jgi:hypothetical protein
LAGFIGEIKHIENLLTYDENFNTHNNSQDIPKMKNAEKEEEEITIFI